MPLADLTNLSNHSFVFDPSSIFAVNEQPGPGGPKSTTVWKVFNEVQPVAGTPVEFLRRYGLERQFVQLKGPRGELWVRVDAVSGVHPPFPGDRQPANIRCMLSVAGCPFTADDDVQSVRRAIDAIVP